jgi:hypothetical protein
MTAIQSGRLSKTLITQNTIAINAGKSAKQPNLNRYADLVFQIFSRWVVTF